MSKKSSQDQGKRRKEEGQADKEIQDDKLQEEIDREIEEEDEIESIEKEIERVEKLKDIFVEESSVDSTWYEKDYREYLIRYGFYRLEFTYGFLLTRNDFLSVSWRERIREVIESDQLNELSLINQDIDNDYPQIVPFIYDRAGFYEENPFPQQSFRVLGEDESQVSKDIKEQVQIASQENSKKQRFSLIESKRKKLELQKKKAQQSIVEEEKIQQEKIKVVVPKRDQRMMTYGLQFMDKRFEDTFNDDKDILPELEVMQKFSTSLQQDNNIVVPKRFIASKIDSKYDSQMDALCEEISQQDDNFKSKYKQPNEVDDSIIIEKYLEKIAQIFTKHDFIRQFLFRDNEVLKEIIDQKIIFPLSDLNENQPYMDEEQFDKEKNIFLNQLRFIILGAPLYCEYHIDNVKEIQKRILFQEQMNYIYEINEDQEQHIQYLNYFMDGYLKREEFFKYNQIKRKEMRQMQLETHYQQTFTNRRRVGFYQTKTESERMLIDAQNLDLSNKFITKYIPFAKFVNISDLLFLNGIKMSVYYKSIRLFLSIYMRLRSSAPFSNTFNFYSIVPDPADGLTKIVPNQNPFFLISMILQTIKVYLSLRMREDFNFPRNFMKELIYIVLPQQATVTCQSIGCLYGQTINDARLEPLVMIATLIERVFSNIELLSNPTNFKIGWNFMKGAYQYISNFKYINTNVPIEWTEFYKQLYQGFLSPIDNMTRLSAHVIEKIYSRIVQTNRFGVTIQTKTLTRQLEKVQRKLNYERTIELKPYIVRITNNDEVQFDVSSLYFKKAYDHLQEKHFHFNFQQDNWKTYQASLLIAGVILDTFIIKIQESLNDKVIKLQSAEQTNMNSDESISQATLQYFSIIQIDEVKQYNDVDLNQFKSMDIIPHVLWIKHCHQSYKPYDIVARDYKIPCVIMLVWFSSTKQYQLGLGDTEIERRQIYRNYQTWQARNYDTLEQCDNIFANSTKLMSTLKKQLKQENLRVIQLANTQYTPNLNQKKDEYLMMNKNNTLFPEFIVGIYYNHIFMINYFIPKKIKNYQHKQWSLSTKQNTKSIYKPLINAIVFDIETTQIKIDTSLETQSHDMIPYMISSIQYQFTQNSMTEIEIQTLFKQENNIDFLDEMYSHWLNQITIWNSDFYIITFNGCKFDLQFMYKYFVKYHSGCIEIFGTLLSPKYIQITFNNHKIKFIDLYLILGDGSLNKWSEKCGLGQKLEFKAIHNINEFLQLTIEEKQNIVKYCEQDVRLTGSIYYLQCLNMVQMLKDLKVYFNSENAIDVLKPTLASTAYSIFKNGFVEKSIRYINSIDWITEQNVRQAYNGGFCHCFQLGEIKGDISYFDINSLYPFIMLQDFPLSPPAFSFADLQLDNILPFLEKEKYTHWKINDFEYKDGIKICLIPQRINSMNFYFKSGYDLQDCYVPSYVLKLILKDLKFLRIRGCLRYNCDFSFIFKDYILKMYNLRQQSKQRKDDLTEKRIKTLMNALYGKTAQAAKLKQDLISSQHRNTFETSGACSFEFNEFLDAYILDIPISKDDSLSYLALEIASRARFYLFQTLYNNKEGIIYCDTDSVILNKLPREIKIDEIELGLWKDVYKDQTINGLYIYSPKVYEVRYQRMENGILQQKNEVKMKGVDKSHKNFAENFKDLQNSFEGSFQEQVVWNKQNGFVRQNKITKKLQHRLRRFVKQDGTTRPFMNIEEYENYFQKQLLMKEGEFIYI